MHPCRATLIDMDAVPVQNTAKPHVPLSGISHARTAVGEKIRAAWIVARVMSNTKNLALVVLALYLSGEHPTLHRIFLVLLSLSAVSSAMYVYNSLTDAALDARNANKRAYAAAINILGPTKSLWLITALLAVGVLTAAIIGSSFALLTIALACVMFLYSVPGLRVKERLGFDVIFGAALTYPLRFAAAWVAFSESFPPLLPLLILPCVKIGGYMLYKGFDRADLIAQGTRNTITFLTRRSLVIVATTCFFLAGLGTLLMIANERWHIAGFGTLSLGVLWIIPAVLPPFAVAVLRALNILSWPVSTLRRIGYLYWLAGIMLFLLLWL